MALAEFNVRIFATDARRIFENLVMQVGESSKHLNRHCSPGFAGELGVATDQRSAQLLSDYKVSRVVCRKVVAVSPDFRQKNEMRVT
jgi:hypothetical protein